MSGQRLPNRRAHETISFKFRGLPYTVGVGRFADGSLAELFARVKDDGRAESVVAIAGLMRKGVQ